MSEENGNILDLGSIDFTPDWAKKDAGVSIGKVRPERRGEVQGGPGGREDRKMPGGRKSFGDRVDRKSFGDRDRGPGDRRGLGGKPFDRRPRFEDRPRPLDVDVKILPEQKALGTIIRKLQDDIHAYKLKDLAYFFLDNPASVLLKITPRQGQASQAAQASQTFHQCKACGFASTRDADVVDHIVGAHLADYYDVKEVDVDPPKGNFNCVARCGLSGVLLGPPNIHDFNAVVQEMIRTRYPGMSEGQYRSHIEMVRDADAIEEWRKGATKRTLFFAKGTADQEGAQGLTREVAESEFRRTILPSLVDTPKNLMITADVALKSPLKPLQWAVQDALEVERRNPHAMCFALRGAFHHRKLKFFRVNDARGQEFVTSVEYREFDAAHAIPELAAAAKFIADRPCCDKSEFPNEREFWTHLQWLVSTGHVVAFTNGVYSAVEKYPKYGPQWKKRPKKAEPLPVEPKAAEPASVPEPAPAPEPASVPEPVPAPDPVEKEIEDETAAVVAE